MKTLARLAAALFAGATLAACSDSPTAPVAARPSDAPSLDTRSAPGQSGINAVRMVWLTVRIAEADDIGKVVPGMEVRFRGAADSLDVWDNSSADLDTRAGFVAIKHAYEPTFQARVSGGNTKWSRTLQFKTATTMQGAADFGTIQLPRSPWIEIKAVNAVFGNAVAGTGFTVSGPNGPYMILTDQMPNFDGNGTVGTLSYPLVYLGTYTFCENVVPTGYYALNPKCFTVDMTQPGKTYAKTVSYSPELKVVPLPL